LWPAFRALSPSISRRIQFAPRKEATIKGNDLFADAPVPGSIGGQPQRPRTGKLRKPRKSPFWYGIAAVIGCAVLTPIGIFYWQAFADGGSGIRGLFALPDFGQTLFNTIALAFGSTVMAMVFALALAKAIIHVPPRFRTIASIIPLLPIVTPPVAQVIGWTFIFSPTVGYGNMLLRQLPFFSDLTTGPVNVYSMPAIVIVTGFDLTGVVFIMLNARLQEIRGPLEAAAKLSGAGGVRTFLTITLPLLRPSLLAGTVVAFLLGLGQFTAPLLLGSRNGIDVLTTELFKLREHYPIDNGTIAAIGLPLLALGIVALIFQRVALGDQRKYVTQTGGSGGVTEKASVWALILVVFYALFAVVLPLAAIALVSISPFWSGDLSKIQFTMTNINAALSSPAVLDSIWTTLFTSFVAVAVALPLGFIGALALTSAFKAPRIVQYALDFSFQAPLAVPRAVLGMAILFVFLRPPFSLYGTYALFIIGYVFVVLPFAMRAQHGSLVGLSGSLFEASRISGAGFLRTVVQIAFPLARRGMVAAASLMIVLLSHDFAVSVMVRSPNHQVMGTQLYEYWATGVYPQVAVMSLIMTLVTSAMVALTLWVGGRSALSNL
jgi:iron(III) transport system permease protein